MKIAVTSQNHKTISRQAGKCRKFWVYDVEDNRVQGKQLLKILLSPIFHESDHDAPHPLDGVSMLISGGIGLGLQHRLQQMGIGALATAETDPDNAVAAWLAGRLIEQSPDAHDKHEYGHGHGHGHGHGYGYGQSHGYGHGQSPQVIAAANQKAHA